MGLTTEQLIEKSIDQRTRERYEEALVSALAATAASPESSEAWWQVALSRLALRDAVNALPALRKVIAIAPTSDGAYARLGDVLNDLGDQLGAIAAYRESLKYHPEHPRALDGLSRLLAKSNDAANADEETSILKRVEKQSYLNSYQTNRLGILFYNKKNMFEALKYWRQGVSKYEDAHMAFNAGLAYASVQINQVLDSIDFWRLSKRINPSSEAPSKSLSGLLPDEIAASKVIASCPQACLPKENWFDRYVCPFELLDLPPTVTFNRLDVKVIQKHKKKLLQEIELEDGKLSWLPELSIDRSRAIAVIEELSDENRAQFHLLVYQCKPLLRFLTLGSVDHFLVSDSDDRSDILMILLKEDRAFVEWLGEIFAPQFDRVICNCITAENLDLLKRLLAGRRWVSPELEDHCFDGARRLIDQLLAPLRNANEKADSEKPTYADVKRLLEANSLLSILNLLPIQFEGYQRSAYEQIRGISISAFNAHHDIDLSHQIIQLARRILLRSESARARLGEDINNVEKLIQEERKYEAKLSWGDQQWHVTKEGVRQGDAFIPSAEVKGARWGIVVKGQQASKIYDFLLVVDGENYRQICYQWSSSDIEKQEQYFGKLVDAVLSYLMPLIVRRMQGVLDSGRSLQIGPCNVSARGVEFDVKGWLFSQTRSLPWNRVETHIQNGDLIISDVLDSKVKVSMPLRNTLNAAALRMLALSNNVKDR